MNTVNAIDTGEKPQPATGLMAPNMNINMIKQVIIMCPATIFANNLIINEAGLISKTLNNSTGIKITFTKIGMPGAKKYVPKNGYWC